MKKILFALALVALLGAGVPAHAGGTVSLVSDTTTDIVGVYNKAGGPANFVDLSGAPLSAVLAAEPTTYPTTYAVDVLNSVWDNGTGLYFQTNYPDANWIWETERAEGPADYDGGDDLYDADASRNGRVVVFEETFDVPGVPQSGTVRVAADNGWEVLVNGNFVERSGTTAAGWETSDLHQASLTTSGWQTVGHVDISSELVSGENTLTILAGNEYFDGDDGNSPLPALQSNPYRQYNPGAAIFAMDVDYLEADIEVVKSSDADPEGVASGTEVEYTYEVTNTGEVDLGNVSVLDDKCSPLSGPVGDVGDDNILSVDETWTYTCSQELFETTLNTVTVTADDPIDNEVSDDDSLEVVVKQAGCTLTQGYWKNHHPEGNAKKADETWNAFLDAEVNGVNWLDALWTPPKGGNVWYQLAHQWIAATLNVESGASYPADVGDALADGGEWLEDYSPEEVENWKGKDAKEMRQEWLDLAGILGDYNEGLIGPGHCEDTNDEPEL